MCLQKTATKLFSEEGPQQGSCLDRRDCFVNQRKPQRVVEGFHGVFICFHICVCFYCMCFHVSPCVSMIFYVPRMVKRCLWKLMAIIRGESEWCQNLSRICFGRKLFGYSTIVLLLFDLNKIIQNPRERERAIKAWHLAQGALQSMIRTFAPCLDMLIKVFMVFKSPDRSWQWEMWFRRWPRRYYQWPPRVFQRNWSRAVKLQAWCHWRLTLQGTNMEM
jgi:hypothetical protein